MIIDNKFLDSLLTEAAASERKRVAYDMRNGNNDTSQRLLNALMPETKVPVHRHRNTSETLVVLRGELMEVIYDDNGKVVKRVVLNPQKGNYIYQIPAGTWHTIEVIEPSIIFEAKDGVYAPVNAKDIMDL